MGHLPVFSAYTGIVSLLHLMGMTCHRLFGLPVSNEETPGTTPTSTLKPGSEVAKLLRAATMIGIDEVLMLKSVPQYRCYLRQAHSVHITVAPTSNRRGDLDVINNVLQMVHGNSLFMG
jgi:hypothetical protein